MIDSSDVVSYNNGWQAGYEMGFSDCKEKLMKAIKEGLELFSKYFRHLWW